MEEVTLLRSSGQERIDQVLQALICRFEATFPGRVSGYYIEGSYANGTGIATSDLDLTILFRGRFADATERAHAKEVVQQRTSVSSVECDASVIDEASLREGASPHFKLGSALVYGEDRRDQLPLVPIEVWTRERMHAAFWLMIHIFNRPNVVRAPLGAPDPADPWLGYARRQVRLSDGTEVPSTRNLIRSTGWAATALVALRAQRYITSKRECHAIYRAVINDEWAALFEDIYTCCREQWQYLLPATQAEQQRLRAICARALAFENHFLSIYRGFLLTQLRATDEAASTHALWVLGQIVYDDAEVLGALQALPPLQSQPVQQAAQAALTLARDALNRPFPLVF